MAKYIYRNSLFALFLFIVTGMFTINTNILAANSGNTPTIIPRVNLNVPHAARQLGLAEINQRFLDFTREKVETARLHQKLMSEIRAYPVEKKIKAYLKYFQEIEQKDNGLQKLMNQIQAYKQRTASPLEGSASISGTITVEGNPPFSTIYVYAFDEYGFFVQFAITDFFTGNYTLTNLDPGNYYVVTRSSYVDEFYNDVIVDDYSNWRNADLVSVAAGEAVTGIDFDLLTGAIITGHFFDEDGVTPLPNQSAYVTVYDAFTPGFGEFNFVYTDPQGFYQIKIPRTGTFKFQGGVFGGGSEFYDNKTSWMDADPVTVATLSDSIGDIDFSVTPVDTTTQPDFALVTGTVVGEDNDMPILGLVFAFNLADTSIGGLAVVGGLNNGPFATQQAPNFQMFGIAPGEYIFYANDYIGPYDGEYYLDAAMPDSATAVTITPGDSIGGIDFTLPIGGVISGQITDDQGTPLDSVVVLALKLDLQNLSAWFTESIDFGVGFSGPAGTYNIMGLSSGDYIVRTFSILGPHAGEVIDEYYGGAQSIFAFDQATPVTVNAPALTGNIDFSLERAGSITGNFYESDGLTPIQGTGTVIAFDANTGYPQMAFTEFDTLTSSYVLAPLPSGDYILLAIAGMDLDSDSVIYVPQFYNGVYTIDDATPVSVVSPNPTTGIDFDMEKPGTIEGRVFIDVNFPVGADSLRQTLVVAYEANSGLYRGSSAVTFAGGYRIGNLPPGEYQVSALPFSREFAATYGGGGTRFDDPSNDIIVVNEADTSMEDIMLQPGAGMIGGSITDQDGLNPLGGIGVLAFDTTGHIVSMGFSWPPFPMGNGINGIQPLNPGEYIIPGLVSGEYYVRTYSLFQLIYLLQTFVTAAPENVPTMGALALVTQPDRILQEFEITPLADMWYPDVPVISNVNLFTLLFRLLFTSSDFFPLFPFQQDIPTGALAVSVTSPNLTGGINFQLPPLGEVVTSIDDDNTPTVPDKFALRQNYPNPFNPITHIAFDIPERAPVKIAVYNLLGQKVKTLVNDIRAAGQYLVQWNGTDDSGNSVASGVYILRMEAADQVLSQKMLLVR